ncbi:MAG TPA: superoxide dismutase family protein [Chloroflexota bacterium]|nr:superoxide dismutase family protein [Chloroflexota bacterium]
MGSGASRGVSSAALTFRALLGGASLLLGMYSVAFAQPATQGGAPTADIYDANGQMVGTATLTEDANGVTLAVQGSGMPLGEHGIHFHEIGRCDPPNFATAGEHFNPTGMEHGLQNPRGPHAGDLPNLTVGTDGTTSYTTTTTTVTPAPGAPNSLQWPNGTALVIHSNADDEKTNPAGNTDGRIACAVIAPPQPGP